MEIEALKKSIEDKTIDNSPIVFEVGECDFVARQYIREIAKIKDLQIECLNSIDEIPKKGGFYVSENKAYVIALDNLDKTFKGDNVYVITKKIDKDIKEELKSIIATIPKLEDWQIRDYAYSMASGVKKDKIDWFLHSCKHNIYRVDNELSKVSLFQQTRQDEVFDDLASSGMLDDITNYSIFDLSNAICTKDLKKIRELYQEIEKDFNAMGFLSILINSFRNIISVQMAKNPEKELTHLSSKQIYAIRKNCGHYTKEQLNDIIEFLYSIDYKVKSGEIETKYLLNYFLDKILTM